MIEVVCTSGDRAEASDPESAFVAARTLLDDAYDAHPFQGYDPTCNFYVDGKPVLVGIHAPAVWATLAGHNTKKRRRP
jgi:hypothetical protein